MLLAPTMDTVEQIDPDQGKGVHGSLGTDWLVIMLAPLAAWTKISPGNGGAKYLACRELCAPFPWSGSICSTVSRVGAGSTISDSGWLAFFDSELCVVRCGDEFGLEFNCKGALNPVL